MKRLKLLFMIPLFMLGSTFVHAQENSLSVSDVITGSFDNVDAKFLLPMCVKVVDGKIKIVHSVNSVD